jgi:hypothetical protein
MKIPSHRAEEEKKTKQIRGATGEKKPTSVARQQQLMLIQLVPTAETRMCNSFFSASTGSNFSQLPTACPVVLLVGAQSVDLLGRAIAIQTHTIE